MVRRYAFEAHAVEVDVTAPERRKTLLDFSLFTSVPCKKADVVTDVRLRGIVTIHVPAVGLRRCGPGWDPGSGGEKLS